MKAPLRWINDFTASDITDANILAEEMTMTGSKVEGVEAIGKNIANVVTGLVTAIEKHPNADKLVVVKVDTGKCNFQIVTGAKNVRVGDIVPVALDGSTLANGKKINSGELRGIKSEGMLCSIEELGYDRFSFPDAPEDGIYILEPNIQTGLDITSVLEIGDSVLDFEITSNRPDCLSIEGIAREAAITSDKEFLPLSPSVIGTKGFSVSDIVDIDIQAPDLCKRYVARAVKNIKLGASPRWLSARLRDAGVRPINNIVDITNYVMIELGQPMHAFDYCELSDHSIIVRRANDIESFTTLDGIKRKLDKSILVIADKHKSVGIAGIMGGENSQINENTTTIIFESACFNGSNIRLSSKKLGLRTESSSRFEKELDAMNALRAMDRACELIEMLGCGEVSEDYIDIFPTVDEIHKIPFSTHNINKFLGATISEEFMFSILGKLGCLIETTEDCMYCIPPSYRKDIEHEVDIAEEIARFYGYNLIEPTLLSGKSTTQGGLTHKQIQRNLVGNVMRSFGFFEACTYSFMSPNVFDKICLDKNDSLRNALVISNPLGEDFKIMRTTMLPSLLDIANTNISRGAGGFDIYEIANVYIPVGDDVNVLPNEKELLSAVSYSSSEDFSNAVTMFRVKGVINELIRACCSCDITIVRCLDNSSLHPGRSFNIFVDGKNIGVAGYIHPDVARNYDLPESIFVVMLELEELIESAGRIKKFNPLPKFPAITRDLAIVVDRSVEVASIENIFKELSSDLLESFELFDVYTGAQIDKSKKSVAYKLVFRATDKTLTDDMINPRIMAILDRLSNDLGAILR